MKKMIIMLSVAMVAAGGAFARPGGPGPGFRHGPGPRHHGPIGHHHHHGGGGAILGGLAIGAAAGALFDRLTSPRPAPEPAPAPAPAPVVVTQPVVVAQPVTSVQTVWVAGGYVENVQADGTIVRTWKPGHYEQRTVVLN